MNSTNNKNRNQLMSAKDVASYLDVSRETAYSIMHHPKLPTLTVGKSIYIRRQQLDDFLDQNAKKIVKRCYN